MRGPLTILGGYYGALLARLSPGHHERYVRRRIRGPYKGAVKDALVDILSGLDRTQDQKGAMEAARDAIRAGLDNGEFDQWIDRSFTGDSKTTLVECDGYLPGRGWKLQLFHIPANHSHPPHSHSDVASCLVVAQGTLHAREYNRFHESERDRAHAILSLSSDRRLTRGDWLVTTRAENDVHWFGAVDGPAVAFNFQAVGFVRGRKALEARRVYVDATSVGSTGRHEARMLKKREAKARFAQKPLSAFPVTS